MDLARPDAPCGCPLSPEATIAAWDAAAKVWAGAVRAGADPRRCVRHAALVDLVCQVPAGPVLDAGCGEGWLTRELAARGLAVQGIDASAAMVELAERAEPGRCRVLPFDAAAAEARRLRGPFGTIVFAESLLAERITPVLMAAGATLFPYGRIVIETPHPAAEPPPYADGWRWMDQAAPGMPLPHRISRYFRTVGTWVLELRRAGLILLEIVEPADEAGRPASLILVATIPERHAL